MEEVVLPEVHLARKEEWTSILEQQHELPLHTRDKINDLVQHCLETVEREIHNLMCGKVPDNYLLIANRDTKEEVENAIRLFPNNLSRRTQISWRDGTSTWEYPIHAILSIGKFVENYNKFKNNESFIALLVRLGKEFDQFDEDERGGLLLVGRRSRKNILQRLATNRLGTDTHFILQVMRQLKNWGYFKKEDINGCHLLFYMISNNFMEDVFRFLVDWDPTALIEVNAYLCTPLYYTPLSCIECFQSVMESGIRYYPHKKGISLLFLKNSGLQEEGSTAFEHACNKFGNDNVMYVIKSTLIDCCRSTDDDEVIDNKSYNTVDALLSAAVDENITLDGVYFFLRREPDILQKLLSQSTTTTTTTMSVAAAGGSNHNPAATTTNNRNNNRNDEDKNNNNNECGLIVPTIDTRKRKRK